MHPLEGFILDTVGGIFVYQTLGLTPRERTTLFVMGTMKTVDDHCGYMFPWDPIVLLGKLTGSDMVYHTIHHQPWGIKVIYASCFGKCVIINSNI
jgi:sphinganine C4-monooxygenase